MLKDNVLTALLLLTALAFAGLLSAGKRNLVYKLFYFVVPLNALADVLIDFSSDTVLHSGNMRAALIGLLLMMALPVIRFDRVSAPIFILLAYLFPLVFFSSNIGLSLNVYVKFALALLMLPLAEACVRDLPSLEKLHRSIMWGVYVFVVSFVFFQVFRFGSSVYRVGSIYTFSGSAKFTYFLAYTMVMTPLMAFVAGGKFGWTRTAWIAGSALVLLLVFHRSSMLAVIAGFGVLFIMGFARSRMLGIGLVTMIAGAAFLFVLAPQYGDKVAQLATRRLEVQREMESEGGRVAESRFVFTTMAEAKPLQLLTGTELFNGGELFGVKKQTGVYRPIHVDYSIILLGSGIIGLVLYLWIFVQVARTILRRTRSYKDTPIGRAIRATMWALLLAGAIISSANQLWSISSLSLLVMYLGALIGVSGGLMPRAVPVAPPRVARGFRGPVLPPRQSNQVQPVTPIAKQLPLFDE